MADPGEMAQVNQPDVDLLSILPRRQMNVTRVEATLASLTISPIMIELIAELIRQ